MNGKEQVAAMAKLMNPDQAAPASEAWKPGNLAGFGIGDHVTLPSIDCTLIVVDLQPPSVLVLRAPSGRELRAGWQAVRKVRTRAEMDASQ